MRGREFSEEHEAANADVIVINETMARQFWAGEDPIGKRLVIRQPRWFTFERRTADPHYSPTGHIVYGVNGTLRAVAFDVERLTVTGNPVPVLEGVNTKLVARRASAWPATGRSCTWRAEVKLSAHWSG